jgi:hypothetical protein
MIWATVLRKLMATPEGLADDRDLAGVRRQDGERDDRERQQDGVARGAARAFVHGRHVEATATTRDRQRRPSAPRRRSDLRSWVSR